MNRHPEITHAYLSHKIRDARQQVEDLRRSGNRHRADKLEAVVQLWEAILGWMTKSCSA